MYRSAFPDVRLIIEEQVAEGDTVVTRWIELTALTRVK